MPRKKPIAIADALAETPATKKTSRRANPSTPSPSNQAFVSRPQLSKRPDRQSSSLVMAVVVIFLIIAALGAYFASAYFQNKSAEEAARQEAAATEAAQAQAEAEAKAKAEVPEDPTLNWSVFALPATASSSIKLSFKYPSELQLTQNADNLILSNPNVTSTQLSVYWVKSNKELKSYLSALDKFNLTSWEGKPSVSITTSTDTVVISGWPSIFRQQKLLAADLNQYITYIKASGTVYAVSLAAPQLDQNLLAFFITFLNNLKLE